MFPDAVAQPPTATAMHSATAVVFLNMFSSPSRYSRDRCREKRWRDKNPVGCNKDQG
jgi:hypothetical protein